MSRPCRVYPLGSNTELTATESGKLYIGSVTEASEGTAGVNSSWTLADGSNIMTKHNHDGDATMDPLIGVGMAVNMSGGGWIPGSDGSGSGSTTTVASIANTTQLTLSANALGDGIAYVSNFYGTSSAFANNGKITTITSTPGAGTYDDVFSAGDYLVIRHQQYGILGVGQWIKVESVTSSGASTVLNLESGAAEFYKYLNASGSAYTGQTSVGITFEKVMGWGVREMTMDQVDDSIVIPIMERWGSYTCSTAGNDFWRGSLRPVATDTGPILTAVVSYNPGDTLGPTTGNFNNISWETLTGSGSSAVASITGGDPSADFDPANHGNNNRGSGYQVGDTLQSAYKPDNTNSAWLATVQSVSGASSNTAGFDLAGYVGQRIRDPDVVGDHPVANNVQINNTLLEWNSGTEPYNGSSFNEGHVDDTDSVKVPIRLKDSINPTVQTMTAAELEDSHENITLEDGTGYIVIDNTHVAPTKTGNITNQGSLNGELHFSMANHGLSVNDPVQFIASTGSDLGGNALLPTGITAGTTYYVNLGWTGGSGASILTGVTNNFTLATSPGGANVAWGSGFQGAVSSPGHYFASGGDMTEYVDNIGDKVLLDTEHSVVERCIYYYTSAANTVGSYFIGTAAGDSDTSSWTSQVFYVDTVIPSSTVANTTYNLYRKESGIQKGWSGSRSLTNANTADRAANCVTLWSGSASDYIVTDGYPGAATDEATFVPLYIDNPNLKELPYTAGASGTLAGNANDAGLHLHFLKRLLKSDKDPAYVGTYSLVSGNTAPTIGTWQFCGNSYDRVTTLQDTIYSVGYEGIYSAAYEGIYSSAYEGIYSQGFTGGYTLTYGSGGESPNPQASSEGPTYSGTYSSGFTGIYSSNYVGIYSGQYSGFYSGQYTGSTVITTLETDTYSLWKRIG